MATRLYATKFSPEENVVGPSPFSNWEGGVFPWAERVGTWILSDSKTNGGTRRALQYNTNQQGNFEVLLLRYMSRPLSAQTIDGTFDFCAYVQAVWIDPVLSPSNDSVVRFRTHVYITQGQTHLNRHTLLDHTDTVDWPGVGAAAWRSLSSAQALTSGDAESGDSIMVEFGLVVVSSPTPAVAYPPPVSDGQNYTSAPFAFHGTTDSSNVVLSDATAGSTDLDLAPWVEFSQDLTFNSPGAAPDNDACADAVVISSLPYTSPRISTVYSTGTQKEVWYTHTFAESGNVIVAAFGSNYLVQLDAAKGSSCGSLAFQLPEERNERLVGTTQSTAIWTVVEGETWWFRIRNKVPTSTDNGTRESGGSLKLRVSMFSAPQEDDLILPCGALGVWREGELVALTAAFFSQFPTGIAADYTERSMDDFNGGTHEDWRLLIGLFGSDIIEIIDLETLNVGESEIDFIADPLLTEVSPGEEVDKHPSTLNVDADGNLSIAFFGNGFQYIDGFGTNVPSNLNTVSSDAETYGGIRVIDAIGGDNQPGAPFSTTTLTGSSEETNPWAISRDANGVYFYTSGSLYIPVGGQEIRRMTSGGTSLGTWATLDVRATSNPGVRGLVCLSDGGVLVCNGEVVQRLNSTGSVVGTYTPSVPELSRVLQDVKVTADGIYGWTVDLGTNTLFKFQLSDMEEVAYYETDMLPGTLTQLLIVQPTPPDVVTPPEEELETCPEFEVAPSISASSLLAIRGGSASSSRSSECEAAGSNNPLSNPFKVR